ncbi:MAG TPA: MFS transporter, partial [Methanocorpusculum sp.]|nr:MFS transporter [Methanocorpusculum sp.]
MSQPVLKNALHLKLVLVTVAIGLIMDGLDGSIVNVVLPEIAHDFHVDIGTISWVTIIYLLMVAGLLLIFGKLADSGHIQKIFLYGFIIFTIGSLGCGLSIGIWSMLVFRMVQGVGAAMIAVTCPMICVKFLPKDKLGLYMGILTIASSLGFAIGPAIGGFIAHYLSWHWIFLINIPIGLFTIPLILKVIPSDNNIVTKPFDMPGAVCSFGFMVLGMIIIERLPHFECWYHTLILVSICVVFIALFVIRELKCQYPLINLRFFNNFRFSSVILAFFIINCVYMGVIYLLPFYLSLEMMFDPDIRGLFLLIPSMITLIVGIPISRWSDRTERRSFSVVACIILVLFNLIFVVIEPSYGIVPLLVALILMGLLWGFAGGPASCRVIEESPNGERGV